MKSLRFINKILAGLIIIAIFFLVVGVVYSYYVARLSGQETDTTITGKTGHMEFEFLGGPEIIADDIAPSTDPFITKNFTIKGTNTTDADMYYKISLIIDENTFSNNAISYTLTGTNTTGNGVLISNITTRQEIGTENKTIGIGNYSGKITEGIHTYELKLYFYDKQYNQLGDLGKTFKAHILAENYVLPKLGEAILAQGGGVAAIVSRGTPDFNVINGTSGIYAADDEYGTSYYYRGVKTELNNNVIFGGFQWKIIRINGDGSIRLLYNGTEAQFNQSGTMNNTGLNTQISTSEWNTNYNDAKYVGYMYGGANGVASTTRNGTVSTAATYNETNTNMKTVLDNWYVANISGKPFETNVVDNLFCNDRQLSSEVGGSATGPGYGNTGVSTYYAAYQRLNATKNPTLKCGQKNDRFTKNDTTIGNGALTYPVGLITADEASMAGLRAGSTNNTNYLYTNQYYWLLSPYSLDSVGSASVFSVFSNGNLSNNSVEDARGVRPAVSINSSARATGTGSATDPFRVQI